MEKKGFKAKRERKGGGGKKIQGKPAIPSGTVMCSTHKHSQKLHSSPASPLIDWASISSEKSCNCDKKKDEVVNFLSGLKLT